MNLYLPWIALGVTLLAFAVLYMMQKRHMNFGLRTIVAMIFGLIIGFAFQGHTQYVSPFGKVFTQLIYFIVSPLLFFSIIASIAELESIKRLKTLGLRSVFWLLLNTFIASTLTVIIAGSLKLGKGFSITLPTDYVAKEVPGFVQTLTNMVPSNLVKHMANNEVIPIIVASVIIGIALLALRQRDEKGIQPMLDFFKSGNLLVNRVVKYVIRLTPYSVVAFIANVPTRDGGKDLASFMFVIVVAYVLSLIQAFLVHGTLIAVFAKMNPLRFFKAIWPAQVVGFTSQSSIGSAPVVIDQVTSKLGVQKDIASFVAGLGANVGMPACTGIWPILLAVFSINALNIPFTTGQYMMLVVYTIIVGLGTAGVPGTATISATAVLAAAGLPIEIIFVLSPISAIVDMVRTMTNVTGSATATVIVATRENAIDTSIQN